jgi:hypothetical protein
MDTAWITALSAVLGSLVGGSTTAATTWITQRTASKRELLQTEFRHREALYGEFISECSNRLIDAMTHGLDKPETLLAAYALLNRIRLSASPEVLAEAEHLLRRITEQYFSDNLTVEQVREIALSEGADPLKPFGEACRAEFASISARL